MIGRHFPTKLSGESIEGVNLEFAAVWEPSTSRFQYRPKITWSGNRYIFEASARYHEDGPDEKRSTTERIRETKFKMYRHMVDGGIEVEYKIKRLPDEDIDHEISFSWSINPLLGGFRKAMSFGFGIRFLIIAAWAGLFGWQVINVGLYYFGIAEKRDLPAIVSKHINYTYHYDMIQGERVVGKIIQDYEFNDGRYPIRTDVLLNDLNFIPGMMIVGTTLLSGTGIDLSTGIRLTTTTTLDKDFQLRELELEGDIGGKEVKVIGGIDHQGFRGTLTWDKDQTRPIDLPDINRERTHGLGMAAALPAGLKPGESFQTASLSPQPTPPYIKRSFTHYFVEEDQKYAVPNLVMWSSYAYALRRIKRKSVQFGVTIRGLSMNLKTSHSA